MPSILDTYTDTIPMHALRVKMRGATLDAPVADVAAPL